MGLNAWVASWGMGKSMDTAAVDGSHKSWRVLRAVAAPIFSFSLTLSKRIIDSTRHWQPRESVRRVSVARHGHIVGYTSSSPEKNNYCYWANICWVFFLVAKSSQGSGQRAATVERRFFGLRCSDATQAVAFGFNQISLLTRWRCTSGRSGINTAGGQGDAVFTPSSLYCWVRSVSLFHPLAVLSFSSGADYLSVQCLPVHTFIVWCSFDRTAFGVFGGLALYKSCC